MNVITAMRVALLGLATFKVTAMDMGPACPELEPEIGDMCSFESIVADSEFPLICNYQPIPS